MPSTSAPRVAILEKHGGLLFWHIDLEEAFRARGVNPRLIHLQAVGSIEKAARRDEGACANPLVVARVARELADFQPDLVLLLRYSALPATTAAAWRAVVPRSTPFIGWLCDHQKDLHRGHIPMLDGVYYFDSATRITLETAYAGRNARLAHMPLAVDPKRFLPLSRPFSSRVPRLVFAGKNTPARVAHFREYRQLGGELDTFGPLARVGLRFWRRRRLKPSRIAALYGAYIGTFNLLQAPNTIHGLNLRAFEVPAAGGLSTYPLTPDLPTAFVPGEEVVAYSSLADLKHQMDSLLRTPDRAAAIAAAGHARVLREHTFAHRAERILRDWLS